MNQLFAMDTRFWEVFDADGKSLGLFMYGDMIREYSVCGKGVLSESLIWLKHINYTFKVVGDVYPLEEDSSIPTIQEWKIKERKKERERYKKRAKKQGYKLSSTMRFGKHQGKTIRYIIEKERAYYNWMKKKNVLLLHPEVERFINQVEQ